MARLYVVDPADGVRVPFLRGILTRSLQDAGLTFEQSYAVASDVRAAFAAHDEISVDELREHVAIQLDDIGPGYSTRYRNRTPAAPQLFVRMPDDAVRAFSRGRHRSSLEACGVAPDDAARISIGIYGELVAAGVVEIALADVRLKTYERLGRDLGPEAAQRYLVWEQFRHGDRPLVLLVGGTTGTGKSTIATRLAQSLDIVRTQSTDMLREVMRMMMPERLTPALHTSSFMAWETLPEPARVADDALIEGYLQQAQLLSVAGDAVIRRATTERVSVVVEGVHAHPAFASDFEDDDTIFVRVMLAVLQPGELQRRIRGRGKRASERRAKRYLKHFDEIWRLQSFLLAEADTAGVPIVVNDDLDLASRELLEVVLKELSKHFTATAEEVFA